MSPRYSTELLLVPDSKGAGGQEATAAKGEWVKRNQKVALQIEHLEGRFPEEKLFLSLYCKLICMAVQYM